MNESGISGVCTNMAQNHEIIHYQAPVILSTPSTPSTSRIPTSHNRKRPANHIPRPPNAFMLYRSYFVNNIREDARPGQQNLSRIAAKRWWSLDPEERAHWETVAKEIGVQHAQRYPNYVYKPVRRESVRKRRQKNSEEELRRCEELQKTYMPETIDQPPVKPQPPPRKRKSRAKKKPEAEVASTISLYPDGQLSTDAFAGNAFMEPLIAPPNLNEQSLEAFHKNTVSEPYPPEVGFSNLGYYDQFPEYNDEYYDTLGVNQIVPPLQIPQPPSAPTTFANTLYERFQRDRAAGAVTTTAMFNAQYVDPSHFNSHSQFFPSSSQSQLGFSANFNCISEPIFQDLLLPPGTTPFVYSQQSQANINFDDFTDSNPPMNFPFMVQSRGEFRDLDLVQPAFNFPTNSEIPVNLDNFNISLDDINTTTLSGNFSPELPMPLFEDVPAFASNDWNDTLESFIDTINNQV